VIVNPDRDRFFDYDQDKRSRSRIYRQGRHDK
jgi:hypothetical protein